MEIEGRDGQQCMNRYDKLLSHSRNGRWEEEEKKKVLLAFKLYPNQWKKISTLVPGRTGMQIRSHLARQRIKKVSWTQEEDLLLMKNCLLCLGLRSIQVEQHSNFLFQLI